MWLVLVAVNGWATVRAAENKASTTLYRRIYVPADHVEAWPRDGEKYLPIEARDFDGWIRAANSEASESPAAATIQEAEYWARFDGTQLVDCRGQWKIAHRGGDSAFLPLGGMSLVLSEAAWKSEPVRPVRLGAWGENNGPADTVGLEVTKDDTLEFAWQAPVKAIHAGLEIAWRLPAAAAVRLNLDLPQGKEPQLEGGVVLDRRPLPADAGPAGRYFVRWSLGLNPAAATTLRLVDAGRAPAESSPELTLREEVSYRITQRGLDIETTWRLDESVHDRRELAMALPKDIRLLSAVVADRELSWRMAKDDQSAEEVAIFKLPNATVRDPLEIRVRAWQPLVLDQPWSLPKLRPKATYWQSGNVEVEIGPPLEMLALDGKDWVQIGVSQSGDDETEPEVSRLAMYSPTSAVSVRIAQRRAQATIRLGSSLALTDPDVVGRLVAEWNVAQGSLHRLSGELAAGWIVEAVETVPAEALGEWFIDERGDRRQIEIQLARAARPGRNVSVILTSRLQRGGVGEPILAKTMRMVDWTSGRVTQHLVTFQTVDPYAVETLGDLPVVAAEDVSDEDRARVVLRSGKETIFELAGASDGAGLKLALERGQYQADIRLDAVCTQQQISRNYHVVIHPGTNGVDRLLFYSTAALSDPQWTEKTANAALAAERLPADDPRWAGLPAAGELWLVRLPGLTTQTVEIDAAIATPWPARKPISLLAMPESAQQRGRVLVRAATASIPALEPEGLVSTALPPEPAEKATGGLPPLRAAYRYDPASCLAADRAARLWVGPSVANDTSLLIARHVELESFFWPNGRATHRATYDLENEGTTSFPLRLPVDAVIRAILLNGQPLVQPVGDRPGQVSSIPLGAEAGSVTVTVHFDIQQQPLRAGRQLEPPLIHNEIPLLAGRWTVWLPEEYVTTISNNGSAGGDFNWRRRLFGPLGRPSKESAFDPLSTRDWARLLSPLGSLSARMADANTDHLGWTAYGMSFVAEGPATVWVAHPPAVTAWAIAMFLCCFVSGRWVRALNGRIFVGLLALAAALTLLLPAAFAPVATAAVLGLLFSLVFRWPRSDSGEQPSHSWNRFSTVSVPSVFMAMVAANLASAEPAGKPSAPREAAQAVERVLIPVDSAGRQAGSKYYVSEQFLRKLLRRQEAAGSRQWILRGAVYMGELRERADPPGIVATEWTVAFDIEVRARDTTVVLPLVRSEASWRETAMLDGVPVPLEWREGGRGCAIEISEPGRYSLTFSCVPKIAADGRRSTVGLTVPPLAGSRLKLQYPKSLVGLTVTGADGAATTAEAAGVLEIDLSDTGRLELQWPPISLSPEGPQSLRVTSMRWLRIGASEVGLQAKYVVEGSARRPEALTVAFDRRWELAEGEGPANMDVQAEPDGRLSVRVPLPPDGADRQEVTLQWRLTGTAPYGRVRLPPIELISFSATHRWLAISTDPDVECEVIEGAASPGAVNEFLAMWGDAEEPPQLVLGTLSMTVPWSVVVRPRSSESLIDEVLHVAAGRDRLRVAYQADILPGRADEYQLRLIVPADLSIDEIALSGSGRRIAARWARVDDAQVNIFMSEPMVAAYRLTLRGSVPADVNRARSLPRVTAAATETALQNVQLYREEEVLVAMSGLTDADQLPVEPRLSSPAGWTARPVGVYRLDQSAFDRARLRIRPNELQFTGPTVLSLRADREVWWADFHGRLTVEQGQLDALKLHGPATWAGPFTLESDVPALMELAAAGAGRITLTIRFGESMGAGKSVEFRVRGPLAQVAQSPISVPEITAEPRVRGKRFVVVPALLDGQPIAWTDMGVRKADLPRGLRRGRESSQDDQTFEIIGGAYHVAMQRPAAVQPVAWVRLADTTVWAAASGAQLIETRLTVAAPELAECILQLPREQELVSVRLDGHPAIVQAADAKRWTVSMGPTPLPRTLEIVTMARPAAQVGRQLQRPLLLANGKPIPVEVSLWSLRQPWLAARLRVAGADTVAEAELRAFRLDRLVSIVEAATPDALDALRPDGYYWFRPWANRLSSLREEAVEKLASVGGRTLSQVSPSAEEQLTRASERLDLWIEQCNELLGVPGLDDEPASDGTGRLAAVDERSPAGHWIYCVAEGGASELIVDSAVAATPRQIRVVGLLAIAGAAAASVWLMRRPATADFLYRWPHAITFLVGIVYWAWLWPSWLGVVIAAGSLLSAWWPGWPGRSLPMERSTVLRVPRSDVVAP